MAFSLTSRIPAAAAASSEAPPFAPGRIIVGFSVPVEEGLSSLFQDLEGATQLEGLGQGAALVGLPEGLEVADALEVVSALAYVTYAEPDFLVTTTGTPAGPLPEILVDTFVEDLSSADGVVTGSLRVTVGPGFTERVEFDLDGNVRRLVYRDDFGNRVTTEVILHNAGTPDAYREETSTGSGPGYFFWSSSSFDLDGNLLGSSFMDSDGSSSSSLREPSFDANGEVYGYRLTSEGIGPDDYFFNSTETFDLNGTLIGSEYSDSSGYSSSFELRVTEDADGATVYETQYTWSGPGQEPRTVVDRFDADWRLLDGDSLLPDVTPDDGPQVLPVITIDTGGFLRAAGADLQADNAPDVQDGTGALGSRLVGTDGDDIFIIDDARDRVVGSRSGTDTVLTDSMSVKLSAKPLKGIENAALIGRDGLDLTGSSGRNRLSGNAGDNRIDGGNGADTLFGGLGNDVFVIRSGAANADQIADFTSGEDGLALTGSAFRTIFGRDGRLRDDAFSGGFLRFDDASGELFFDRDGDRGGVKGDRPAVLVAVLIGVPDLDADDFSIG